MVLKPISLKMLLSLIEKQCYIKVVTGLRRSGKSYLVFHLFKDYLLKSGVEESHVIAIELDLRENRQYRNPDALLDYVHSRMTDSGDYYVLLDEVQMLDSFEEVLNSLLIKGNVDAYVTGSNSKFLSKDVITEFRGRGDEVRIHPLTFKEFMQVYKGDMHHGLADYLLYGGLPLTLSMRGEEQKSRCLETLFTETYIKDIVERNALEKEQELGDLINILASSVGSLSNAAKIEATFGSVAHLKISQNTIRQYIECLKDSFLINEASRYDVKGRKHIGSPMKYYFEDVGLRNARLGFKQVEENHLMENVIYNELLSRGFNVDVGIVPIREDVDGKSKRKHLEVDFVANKGSKRYYIQAALRSVEEAKAPLLRIHDYFKKIVIVKDSVNVTRDEKGIVTMSLYDFLLKEGSLDL